MAIIVDNDHMYPPLLLQVRLGRLVVPEWYLTPAGDCIMVVTPQPDDQERTSWKRSIFASGALTQCQAFAFRWLVE